MLLFDQRVFYSDNGVISDLSVKLNDFRSQTATIPFVTGEDYLYIGTYLPFNHRYIDIQTANTSAATINVEIWDGKTFNSAIDVIDQTAVGSVALAQDGFVRWSSNRSKVWFRELDSFNVTGLSGTNVSSLYWLRLSWSASLFASTSLKYIGNLFSTDAHLFSYYPDLNNTTLMGAFANAKTDWKDQHYMAAEQIINDLRKKSIIDSRDQILDYELFLEPSVHKVAELIYAGSGSTFEDKRKAAEIKYNASLDQGFQRIDVDGDANLSSKERLQRTGFLSR